MVLTLSLMDLFLINADHVPEAEMAEQHHFQAPSYASLDHSRKHLQSMSDLTSLSRPGEKRLEAMVVSAECMWWSNPGLHFENGPKYHQTITLRTVLMSFPENQGEGYVHFHGWRAVKSLPQQTKSSSQVQWPEKREIKIIRVHPESFS